MGIPALALYRACLYSKYSKRANERRLAKPVTRFLSVPVLESLSGMPGSFNGRNVLTLRTCLRERSHFGSSGRSSAPQENCGGIRAGGIVVFLGSQPRGTRVLRKGAVARLLAILPRGTA